MARRRAAAAASRRDLRLGRLVRLLPRDRAPRRHPVQLLEELARAPGDDACSTASASAARRAASPASRSRRRRRCRDEELAKNRADTSARRSRRAIRGRLLSRAHGRPRRRSTVPLLSAANWGGQGLHPRGNFEGFSRAGSRQKWLEVHGDSHWAQFYTDYGVGLQKRFFGHFLKGEDNGWDKQPRVSLNVRHPARSSCCARRTNGRSRARSGRSSISIPTASRSRRAAPRRA